MRTVDVEVGGVRPGSVRGATPGGGRAGGGINIECPSFSLLRSPTAPRSLPFQARGRPSPGGDPIFASPRLLAVAHFPAALSSPHPPAVAPLLLSSTRRPAAPPPLLCHSRPPAACSPLLRAPAASPRPAPARMASLDFSELLASPDYHLDDGADDHPQAAFDLGDGDGHGWEGYPPLDHGHDFAFGGDNLDVAAALSHAGPGYVPPTMGIELMDVGECGERDVFSVWQCPPSCDDVRCDGGRGGGRRGSDQGR